MSNAIEHKFHDWYLEEITIRGNNSELRVSAEGQKAIIECQGVVASLVRDNLAQNIIYNIQIINRTGMSLQHEQMHSVLFAGSRSKAKGETIVVLTPSVGAEIIVECETVTVHTV